jgi:CheY-like chemotaxis protein
MRGDAAPTPLTRAKRQKVLVVDDEDSIALSIYRFLYQDNHRYDILLAGTAEIAQQILLDIPIDVLVTDIRLPEKSGMDLLAWVMVESPLTMTIVMTAFDVAAIKHRAHALGCLRLMRKPFDVHELRTTILKALDRRDSFSGNLSELSAIDVIQMLCIARKTTSLRLSEGQNSGVILIKDGEIIHAIWNKLAGEKALFAMMLVTDGLFNTSQIPTDIERTIQGDWQYLLIEGMRRLDEAAAGIVPEEEPEPSVRVAPANPQAGQNLAGSPTPGASPAQSAPPPADAAGPPSGPQRDPEVSRLVDQGFAALRSGKRDDARKYWEEALKLEPANRMIELNLRKLEAKNLRDQR